MFTTALTGAFLVTGGIAFVLLRRRRWRKLHEELGAPVINLSEVNEKYRPLWPDAAATGAVSAYDAVWALAMIDERVLSAMNFSSKLDLGTFNQLNAYVHEHFLSGGEESVKGAMERLEGYTAEQVAAAHLAAQGHVVQFPETPNQQGWDLLVDGHPVQVKNTMDPELIKQHLIENPDIPVIVNTEMGAHFAGNDHVIVDPDLSHAAIAEQVQDTIHGVDALDAMSFHVPLVTLALSSLREGALWADGRIDAGTALKRVGTDVVAVGGGGAVGSKLGLLLGGLLGGPFVAAFLGIGGAIGGAMAGRAAANAIRLRPLNEAKEELNRAIYRVVEIMPAVIDEKKAALGAKQESIRRRLKVGFWSWLWPSRAHLLFKETERRIQGWLAKLDEEKKRWQTFFSYEQKEHGISRTGLELCGELARGGYYHPKLIVALREVSNSYGKVMAEAEKLGLGQRESWQAALGKAAATAMNWVEKFKDWWSGRKR